MDIERRYRNLTPSIASGQNLSETIDMRPFAGGVLSMPAAWTAASIGFKHCATIDGTYQTLNDDAGSRVEMAVAASGEYVLPQELFACAFIKLWSETSGSDTNQGGARSFSLFLKG
jgi:hypothetical protein